MEPKKIEDWKENVRQVVQKITKQQISELLTSTFELEEMPPIIALNRGLLSIKGFTIIHKKVFAFNIAFVIQDNKYTLKIVLQFGKQTLMKDIEITVEKNASEIDIFATNNRQYLLSVYL